MTISMSTNTEPEIILYDLASTKGVCFSPVVWRIRLMLNYKHIPYKTIFLEFPDIEPTLKDLGIPLPPPHTPGSRSAPKYSVPAIHHIPSNKHIMDSSLIAQFLESTYPNPPLPLTSDLGRTIESQSRAVIGTAFSTAILPREIHLLSPRAQEYYRRTREAMLGHSLEEELAKEEEAWNAVDSGMRAVGALLETNSADGQFVLGKSPSYTDFFIAGSLQSARVVEESVFERVISVPGFKRVYEACLPFMTKED